MAAAPTASLAQAQQSEQMRMRQDSEPTSHRIRTWLGRFRRRLLGTNVKHTVAATKLEAMYARSSDPWGLASPTNTYERDKYLDTVAQLTQMHYPRALEVGCSVGALTAQLAPRCGALLGIDLSEVALAEARVRNRDQPHIGFARHRLPDDPPPGQFNLLVFSEVLYFFDANDLRCVAAWAETASPTDGEIVLVNYTGPLAEYPLTGDGAATIFIEAIRSWAEVVRCERREHYRIDILRRRK